MPHEVYIFGDSHWRVFFPFLNEGEPGVCHEQDGIVTLDTTSNELSGSTMWGLLNDLSRHGARRRILDTIDARSGVENVGLVFGEVDVRFHNLRYFTEDGHIRISAVYDLISRYKRFIDEDLLGSGRVHGHVFVYFGFRYPMGEYTHPFSGSESDRFTLWRMNYMTETLESSLPQMLRFGPYGSRIHVIVPGPEVVEAVSDDGVHLTPSVTFGRWVFPVMREVLG